MPYTFSETTENIYQKLLLDNPGFREKASRQSGGNRSSVKVKSPYFNKNDVSIVPREDLLSGNPDGSPLTTEEEQSLERMIDNWIRDAFSHDRGVSGSFFVPDALLSIINAKPLNWRKLLKEFLSEAQSDETSYITPERKYLHMDMILPGHGLSAGGDLESVWAFVDSSGSISHDDLNKFLTELYHIVKEFQCEMNIAYWDTKVTDVYKKIRRKEQIITAQPHHSGGTDINCLYRYVRETKLKPIVSIILTDGYFGIPDPILSKVLPSKKTILLLCNNSKNPVYKKVGRVCRLS